MEICDYSGWMRKRPTNLTTTMFRNLDCLSYAAVCHTTMYSETDESEAWIDVTGHQVLRADDGPDHKAHKERVKTTIAG